MKNVGRGLIKFLIAILLIAGSLYIGYQSMPLIKLGLDLNGGVSITYKATTANPTSQEMDDAVYKMQLKAQDYSSEAEVYKEGNDRINIDIPGVNNAEEILSELGQPGTLKFVEGELVFPELADNLSSLATASNAVATGSNATNTATSSSLVNQILSGNVNVEGANVIQNADGTITIGGSGDLPEGATLLKSGETQYDYDAAPDYAPDQVVLTGNDIQSARAGMYDDNGKTVYAVDLVFNESGKQIFAEATERNQGQIIYILYNEKVVSSPTVQATIKDGRAQITGMEDLESAERLASTIRIGAMPVELEEIRSNVVGAKLGDEAISTSIKAGVIGFAVVCLFMIVFYLLPGFAASIALCMYVGLMLFLLNAFEVTLTLPGIAGIILSIGMAVDANVIIFTRIKEEIGAGRGTHAAVKEGFSKALSAIMDGNITTLIACLVLFVRGTGSIKGFATTLALGIVLSLFTALFVTRFVLNALIDIGLSNEKLFGSKKDRQPIKFTNFRLITYIIPAILLCISIIFAITNIVSNKGAFEYGLDFKGGSSTSIIFNEELSREEINDEIVPLFEQITGDYNTQFQKSQGTNEVIIKTRTLTQKEREAIKSLFVAKATISEVTNDDENVEEVVENNETVLEDEVQNEDVGDVETAVLEDEVQNEDAETAVLENEDNETVLEDEIESANEKNIELSDESIEDINDEMIEEEIEEDIDVSNIVHKEYNVLQENFNVENISGAVSVQMRQDAIIAVILASILMLIYIWFRFKDIRFASSAVIALIHDCFITIGCYAVFRWTVDSTFIACMLTILGYSINATIVIFDRIRENLVRMRGTSLENIVNTSITQTFTRSINTSLTTFIMVLFLYIFGVSSIKMFALPLMIGITAGAYSSICITGCLWYDMKRTQKNNNIQFISDVDLLSSKKYKKNEEQVDEVDNDKKIDTTNNQKSNLGKKRKKHR